MTERVGGHIFIGKVNHLNIITSDRLPSLVRKVAKPTPTRSKTGFLEPLPKGAEDMPTDAFRNISAYLISEVLCQDEYMSAAGEDVPVPDSDDIMLLSHIKELMGTKTVTIKRIVDATIQRPCVSNDLRLQDTDKRREMINAMQLIVEQLVVDLGKHEEEAVNQGSIG